jgi:ribokinase
MRVLNFGSLNIDHVYQVDSIVHPGETIPSLAYAIHAGGKGANQSMALARAGVRVCHVGQVGHEGEWLRGKLADAGVDVGWLRIVDEPGGHAIIQVDRSGENAIVLHGGANRTVPAELLTEALGSFDVGDWLLVQNETNRVAEAIRAAHARGLRVCLNPAPITPEVRNYPLNLVDCLILNQTEAAGLTGCNAPDAMLEALAALTPAEAILTLGADGACFRDKGTVRHVPAAHVSQVVDTTGAGDTFVGYFLALRARGKATGEAVAAGCLAAARCVERAGAMDSIPLRGEV